MFRIGHSRWLPVVTTIAVGSTLGLGAMTFHYAEGGSYLSTDPAACANCHIMQSQYDSWQMASHHTAAGCVDCHLPAQGVAKYAAKLENGWHHSKAFTLQNFREPIHLTPANQAILQVNCLRCHQDMVHEPSPRSAPDCVRCHVGVGHGERVALGGPWGIEPTERPLRP